MAGSRKPGPLALNPEVQDLNDGTMIRALSPRPGPIGGSTVSVANVHGKQSVASLTKRAPRKKASQAELQVLRQGSRGPEVQKLQRQINARLTPSPKLAGDGMFGSLTHQAVLQYQKGVSIAADGIVWKQTWYHLLKGNKATVLQASVPRTQLYASGSGATSESPNDCPDGPGMNSWLCSSLRISHSLWRAQVVAKVPEPDAQAGLDTRANRRSDVERAEVLCHEQGQSWQHGHAIRASPDGQIGGR